MEIKIGIITALPVEYAAMYALLEDAGECSFPGRGAGNQFGVGKLPSKNGSIHLVALAMCVVTGNNNAAISAMNMLHHFPSIENIIMTGIAGGVPDPTDVSKHVRLGDIIVSDGIMQYDYVKDTENGIICRSQPPKPGAELLQAINHLKVNEHLGNRSWEKDLDSLVARFPDFNKPAINTDVLHDVSKNIIEHPIDGTRTSYPKIFYGKIGSANTLLRNPILRNMLKDEGIHAIEMEGSGVADATWTRAVGYIVIRGACDYCDSYKNDIWHPYSAAVASAYTRSVVEQLT